MSDPFPSGKGIAPDGSAVELYTRLEPMGEPELIHAVVPAGCEILELGSGAGRITHPLLALGHTVVAVDQSPEMLARIRGAETVVADIETLSLGRRFPVVVLASNFINDAEASRRRTYLDCCARHVLRSGQVLLERFPPDWEPKSDWVERGGLRMRLRSFTQQGNLVSGEMEYVVEGRELVHAFTSVILGDKELDGELAAAGLRRRRILGERGSWVEPVLDN